MSDEKLKPCPFCGGEAELISVGRYEFFIKCHRGCVEQSHVYKAKSSAINAWNRRKAEREWIPCSERLPEDDELMLVHYVDPREGATTIWIGWHEMENVWYIDGDAHSREFGNEVIAWTPLPKEPEF